jgi:hypothetical protein
MDQEGTLDFSLYKKVSTRKRKAVNWNMHPSFPFGHTSFSDNDLFWERAGHKKKGG